MSVISMKYVSSISLHNIGVRCLVRAGMSKHDALIVADALTMTSLRGVDSHGVRLLPHYIRAILLGRINPKPSFHFHKRLSAAGTLHADHGLGILAGMNAMERCISIAKKTGMGSVAVTHSSHFGAAGLYTIKAANEGMIGFACTQVEALVLPYNGKKPFLGTNAISIAVPCKGEGPVCLDMATTNMSLNKLNMYKAAKQKIPEGWAADTAGRTTRDPKKARYLTHFGGYKGYGFAFMVDVFSSMLTGMPWGPHIVPMFPVTGAKRNLGHFFWAIHVEGFEKLAVFKKRMQHMVTELRQIPPSGNEPVMVPGDPEKKEYAKRTKAGTIPIPEPDYRALTAVAKELGVEDEV